MGQSILRTGFLLTAVVATGAHAAQPCPCAARVTSHRVARTTTAYRTARATTAYRAANTGTADRIVTERTVRTEQTTIARPLVLPAGADIPVRLAQSLDTKRDAPGTPFVAHVAAPVAQNGVVVLPRGAMAR